MSVYLTLDWLVPREHERDTEAALVAVRDHVRAQHPRIRSIRVSRAVTDHESPIGFRWEERYDRLDEAQNLDLDEACDQVWLGVWHLAVAGSHRQTLWDDQDRPDWLTG